MSIEGLRTASFHNEEPPMTFPEFESKFPNEEAAIDYFINIYYGGVLTCRACRKTLF
jgi:hypothetical protein